MRIVIGNTEAQNALMPIRWCLTLQEADGLRHNLDETYVLVVTRHVATDQEERFLFPVDRLMGYITFRRPGKHRVMAFIVQLGDEDSKKSLIGSTRVVLDPATSATVQTEEERLGHTYEQIREAAEKAFDDQIATATSTDDQNEEVEQVREVGAEEEQALENWRIVRRKWDSSMNSWWSLKYGTEEIIAVDPHFFAKDPPDKWWLNFILPAVENQCVTRGRRMFAYTIQIPIVLFGSIFIALVRALIALGFAAFGLRGTKWSPVIHPFRDEWSLIWEGTKKQNSVFLCSKDGQRRPAIIRVLYLRNLLTVLFWVGLTAVAIFLVIEYYHLIPLWVRVVVGVILAFIAIVGAITLAVNWAPIKRWLEDQQRKEDARQKEIQDKKLESELEVLSCDGNFLPSIKALPRQKRTFHLRFMDTKARVCKPYAK